MKIRGLIMLFVIFNLGIFLRFYQLGQSPSGLHRDEAFLGYNAYSILKTGRDINGNFLPGHLQSFLYSPAGYSYSAIPFIFLFDLSPFSIRFPAALFGSLTIIPVFYLVINLFHQHKNKIYLALLSALLIAISPWHINLSRTATENVLVVFLITSGILCFTNWLNYHKTLWLIISFFLTSLTLLIYQAPRAFLPLFIPLLIFVFWKKISKKSRLVLYIFYILLILVPIVIMITSPNLSLRLKTVSIFSTTETQLVIDEQQREDGVATIRPLFARIYHNKIINYGEQFAKNFFSHLSYNFLYTDQGLPIRYKIPGIGLLYLIELPLLLFGIVSLINLNKGLSFLLLGWIVIGIIGSALTFDDIPNLQRTLIIFPALPIITAFGFIEAIQKINKKIFKALFILLTLICLLYYFTFYIHQYYVHQKLHHNWYRHDGYELLVHKINQLLPNYKKAIVTDRESAPAIFFLFYSKYDPKLFQEETKMTTVTDFDRINFGKYEFTQEECPLKIDSKTNKINGAPGIIYVNYATCQTFLESMSELDVIKRSDQTSVFRVANLK